MAAVLPSSSGAVQAGLLLEIGLDRRADRPADADPVFFGSQQALFGLVRQIADLDEDRGHGGGLEHHEAGGAVGVAEQLGHPTHLAHQIVCELFGKVHGFALGQVDQDLADICISSIYDIISDKDKNKCGGILKIIGTIGTL